MFLQITKENLCLSRLDLLKYMEDLVVGAHFPLLIQTSGGKLSPGHKSLSRSPHLPAASGSRRVSLDLIAGSSPCPEMAKSAPNSKPASLQCHALCGKLLKRNNRTGGKQP